MNKIGIFYGSSMGYSEHVASLIQQGFGADVADVHNVLESTIEDVNKYKYLVLGCSSWGKNELQEDMEEFFHETLKHVDYKGRKVALFGLGDQVIYGHQFLEALGILYNELKELNADLVGKTSADDYTFMFSEAYVNGQFVGLAIDEENQEEKTADRVKNWVNDLKKEFSL